MHRDAALVPTVRSALTARLAAVTSLLALTAACVQTDPILPLTVDEVPAELSVLPDHVAIPGRVPLDEARARAERLRQREIQRRRHARQRAG